MSVSAWVPPLSESSPEPPLSVVATVLSAVSESLVLVPISVSNVPV